MDRIDGKTMEELRQECSLLTTDQLKAELERRGAESTSTVDLLREINQKLDNANSPRITRAEIMKIEDPIKRQKAIEEHYELFVDVTPKNGSNM